MGQVSALLDINQQTLRRWDDEGGKLKSHRSSTTSHRYYYIEDIEDFLSQNFKYLLDISNRWAFNSDTFEIPPRLYCSDRAIFKARLSKLEAAFIRENPSDDSYSLITSIVGEIGNNSFDHNLGKWPDLPGIVFGYSLSEKKIVLADRGQGILATLSRVREELKEDKQAIRVAFTEIVSGRAPENRGNGLKYVRKIAEDNANIKIFFQSGQATVNIRSKTEHLNIGQVDSSIRGCFAIIEY